MLHRQTMSTANSDTSQDFQHDNSSVCMRVYAVFFEGASRGLLSVLYYKGVFIASISDAVSSHPVSPRLCTHTETEEKSKEGKEGAGGLGDGRRGRGRLLSKEKKKDSAKSR